MLSKALYKISVISPVSAQDKQVTETKMSNKISQYQRSTNSKLNTSLQDYKKPISLSFNLGRMKPKTITHDKQALYEENMRLKQTIKCLNQQVHKLRTRVSISEQQVSKVIQASYSDISKSNSNMSMQKIQVSHNKIAIYRHKTPKLPWMHLQSQNILRQQTKKLHLQIQNLKNQNQKLRKSLKYTQISQISIQNQKLTDQCIRLKKLLQSLTSKGVKQQTINQKQYESMKIQYQKVKENNKIISNEIRNKMKQNQIYLEEIERLKQRQGMLMKEVKSLREENIGLKDKQKQGAKKDSGLGLDSKIEGNLNYQQPKKKPSISQSNKSQQLKEKKQKVSRESSRQNITQSTKKKSKILFQQNQQQNSMIFHHKNRKLVEQNCNQVNEQNQKKKKEKHQQIRQLLTYRFQNQRYVFEDFVNDISKFNIKEFTYEQLKSLLKSEPFLLEDAELQYIFEYIYEGKQHNKMNINLFLEKIKYFVSDFNLIAEYKEQSYLSKWHNIIKQNQKTLKSKTTLVKTFTRSQFQNLLFQTQVKRQQMDVLIGQAAMVSSSLKKINLQQFLKKMLIQ